MSENKNSSSDGNEPSTNITTKEESVREPRANLRQAYMLGLAMKLGGCCVAWNYGLITGFWEYLIAVVLVGLGYLMLGLCMAEMVSIMTFDGGYYGYARVILGPLGGFLVGCSGLMESVFFFAAYVMKIGQLLQVCFDIDSSYDKLLWLAIYLTLIVLMILSCRYFWQMTSLFSLGVIVLLAIFLFGSMPSLDFQQYALKNTSTGFTNDPLLFLDIFRLSVVFFIGFDLLTLTSSEVKESKKNMPYAMLGLIGTVFVLSVWLMFTVASQAPGTTSQLYRRSTYFPLVFGFMNIFNINYKAASAMAGIPIVGSVVSYFYIIARQVKAMASSGLLPHFLNYTFAFQGEEVPIAAYVTVCIAAYGANHFAFWVNIYTTSTRAATIAGCFVYLSMFYCYVIFERRFGYMERTFRNPLGLISAVVGSVIFSAILVIMLVFHPEFKAITLLYFIYMAVMLAYYYIYAESAQYFSVSEQKVFFKAYIINFQKRKKKTVYQKLVADVTSLLAPVTSLLPCSTSSGTGVIFPQSDRSVSDDRKGRKPAPPSTSDTRVTDSETSRRVISTSERTTIFKAVHSADSYEGLDMGIELGGGAIGGSGSRGGGGIGGSGGGSRGSGGGVHRSLILSSFSNERVILDDSDSDVRTERLFEVPVEAVEAEGEHSMHLSSPSIHHPSLR